MSVVVVPFVARCGKRSRPQPSCCQKFGREASAGAAARGPSCQIGAMGLQAGPMTSSTGGQGKGSPVDYAAAGVDTEGAEGSLRALSKWIEDTFAFNPVKPVLPLGYFANVLALTEDIGLAISTDGVGTKLLVAQEMGKYDTVGIDCVAMNANDILCVGARPVSMVDYIAVERAEPAFLAEIAKGLNEGARQAAINIPGGEIAQVREMLHPTRDGRGFDLVGTCVGTVHPKKILIGADVRPGDAVVGLASSGVHSNGLTLARRVLLGPGRFSVGDRVAELGRTVGEELLEPTRIYVKPALRMFDAGLRIKAMAHMTGDGFLNICRVEAPVGFVLDAPLPTLPVFSLIQARGELDDAEMHRVYNMGTGFCVVVDPSDAAEVVKIAREHGDTAAVIGYAVDDPRRRVWIPGKNLVGEGKSFAPATQPAPPRPRS